jgi:23S rRNA pseudouridine1911/1915/1917 synthase
VVAHVSSPLRPCQVDRHPALDEFRIEAPIGPVPHDLLGTLHGATPEGKPSASVIRVLERRQGCSLVEVDLITGRPHQIRIHMAFAGHPLIGDPLYGPGGKPLPGTRSLPGDLGYLLHAVSLELPHPRTGENLHLFCQAPPVLRAAGCFQ